MSGGSCGIGCDSSHTSEGVVTSDPSIESGNGTYSQFVNGLNSSTRYTCRVRARNAVGDGPAAEKTVVTAASAKSPVIVIVVGCSLFLVAVAVVVFVFLFAKFLHRRYHRTESRECLPTLQTTELFTRNLENIFMYQISAFGTGESDCARDNTNTSA